MKQQLRSEMHRIRSGMSAAEVRKNSSAICERLKKTDAFKNATSILFYLPIGNEVDTAPLISETLSTSTVLLPYVNGDTLSAGRIRNLGDVQQGAHGTREPKLKFHIDIFDIVIVPGLAFDEKKQRVGYGKGYYDRFLTNTHATKIGLAYEDQIVEKIAVETHDVPMDFIITEKRII